MSTLIQIANYAVPANEWLPLCCPVPGSVLKLWFQFDGDLKLRSDPANAATEFLCAVAKGNLFDVPVIGPVGMDGSRPVAYAQAAVGTVNVTLFAIMQ